MFSRLEESTRREIAARLRGLIAGQDHGDMRSTAKRLGVDEVSLRISTDVDSPYPTIDVLIAVIITYSVDPSYLLTGDYDPHVHRQTLENPDSIGAIFGKLWLKGSDGIVISRATDDPRQHSA
ncbi:MAG TPA: hypothetical protein VKH19_00480 [Gemmatimonadaceae bacterium]|nr:hypothetical protein [Gemmatimonadaceae bacterium]